MSSLLNCDSYKSPGKLTSTRDHNQNDRYVAGREKSEALASENFEESDLHLYIPYQLKEQLQSRGHKKTSESLDDH